MKTRVNRVITLLAGLLTLVASSHNAFAHSFPDKTIPAPASVVAEAPSQLTMHFDNQFNPSSSKVRVLNESGDVMSSATEASADHRTLSAELKPLAPGQYFVKWSALSQDGERTMGAFSFTVKPAP
jgi:methionine-rich copper-binding protein CopC